MDKLDIDIIYNHITKNNYKNWTISEIIMPKLYNNYITSCRVYFLITKTHSTINCYIYDHFMIYRARNEFNGNILDKYQFLTNYSDRNNPEEDKFFIFNRFIPYNDWLSSFSSEEQLYILKSIENIIITIVNCTKDDILSSNENNHNNTQFMGFHLYGADILITDDMDIKIIEINCAPTINDKTREYGIKNRLNYIELVDDLCKIVIDNYWPKRSAENNNQNKFRLIYNWSYNNIKLPLYYIPNSVIIKYPQILGLLNKRKFMKRTKNVYDDISIFYGLRERYITDKTNMNYYDELLNYISSSNMINASIINKIQGITYYLGNKGIMYNKLVDAYGDDITDFHPISKGIVYNINKDIIFEDIMNFLKKNNKICTWILKPVDGSRGFGIKIFSKDKGIKNLFLNNNKQMATEISNYVYNNLFFEIKTSIVNEITGKIEETTKKLTYKYWILSAYIDNPHLLKINSDLFGRKYNLRFYGLVILNDLPTYGNINDNFIREPIGIIFVQ